jgi:hypothetical protein
MRPRRISIRRGDLVCIRDGAGVLVAVERGTAWLTQGGDRRDVVLEAGGSFRLDRTGVAVVSTDASTELSIIAAAGASLPAIETSSRATRAARALARGGRLAYEF